jgi:hypothetical protein
MRQAGGSQILLGGVVMLALKKGIDILAEVGGIESLA